jgi:hypothetical protein
MLRLTRAFQGLRQAPREVLIDGPAGTGKTYGILVAIHLWLLRNPNARALFARAHRASLSESVLVTWEQDVLPLTGHEHLASGARRQGRQNYVYPNGSEVIVAGLDKASKVLSAAYDVVFVNEAIELPQPDQWETILSRQKRPGRPVKLGILIGDTNPGDPQHWLKQRCDRGECELWSTSHEDNPALHDGDAWTAVGLDYRDQLGRLTGTRRKRLRDGIWCAGEGAWFEGWDEDRHVTTWAEYDPYHPVHLAVDTGVHTGAVWYQIRPTDNGPIVAIFGDYYGFPSVAYETAKQIQGRTQELCKGRVDVGRHDPAGNAATGTGTTITAEYERAGLKLKPWLKFPGCVSSGLGLVESFLGGEPASLAVHPRCRDLRTAFANYKRKQRGGQWIDEPEDPQHPHEDVIDSLRSGLLDHFPEGRRPAPKLSRARASRVF